MPKISEVAFSDESFTLVNQLVESLKAPGYDGTPYRVNMNGEKGELRLAHIGPDANRKKGRGVFARIIPSKSGATLLPSGSNPKVRIPITKDRLPEIARTVEARRQEKAIRERTTERAEPNVPGNVQGGQVESNPRRH